MLVIDVAETCKSGQGQTVKAARSAPAVSRDPQRLIYVKEARLHKSVRCYRLYNNILPRELATGHPLYRQYPAGY